MISQCFDTLTLCLLLLRLVFLLMTVVPLDCLKTTNRIVSCVQRRISVIQGPTAQMWVEGLLCYSEQLFFIQLLNTV